MGNCKNCKHWHALKKRSDILPNEGQCLRIKDEWGDKARIDWDEELDAQGRVVLVTREDFGCVLFERREA